jgi:molybdopterin synthase catalytic subunit
VFLEVTGFLIVSAVEGKQVESLNYTAYEAMAIRQLNLIVDGVRKRWPQVLRIAIHHRTGTCAVLEESVCIAASSPHRKEAFEIVEFIIDELKRTVPIWKQEVLQDGSKAWKQGCCSKKVI